ncbi:FAD:protein FMN transferase [Pseudarthrobacter sp. P1]|uniref:FAD:protein FMN transferase n=1 Tax=Pseudarthrobacter sp. P1 TaxID=3418418 RepID=UPI003CE8BF5B
MAAEVFETMGTVASITFPGTPPVPRILRDIRNSFARFEDRFSLYRPGSEISRLARGELRGPESSAAFRDAYAQALQWRSLTHGAFTPHRPDGVIDLSGIVKAQAMEAAGALLLGSGATDWMLNVGGDILVHGSRDDGGWQAGIVDPLDHSVLLAGIALQDPWRAIATSGTAERGEHIWRLPQATPFAQVSVLAADIIDADVLATAILAGGVETLNHATDTWDIDVVCVDRTGGLMVTKRLRGRLPGATG